MITEQAWLDNSLDEQMDSCYTEGNNDTVSENGSNEKNSLYLSWQYLPQPDSRVRDEELDEHSWAASQIQIASAATSWEGIGNPVYPPAHRRLAERGISCGGRAARQLINSDYEEYDLLIGMDKANLRDIYRICGGDFVDKMHLLMNFADHPDDVADPWYTDDFEMTWRDVLAGC